MTFENILSIIICLLYVGGLLAAWMRLFQPAPKPSAPVPEPAYDVKPLLEWLPRTRGGFCTSGNVLVLMQSAPTHQSIHFVNLPHSLGQALMVATQEMWEKADTTTPLLDVERIEGVVLSYTRRRKLNLLLAD